eukprot:6554372-Prymnesium_polylepis.1
MAPPSRSSPAPSQTPDATSAPYDRPSVRHCKQAPRGHARPFGPATCADAETGALPKVSGAETGHCSEVAADGTTATT